MKPRYFLRAVVQASAVYTVDGRVSEGKVLDLTVPGCLIDSQCPPRKGDSLELCLDIPRLGFMFRVTRGVVRWVEGSRFGVEFIEMAQPERLRYNATVSRLLHERPVIRTSNNYPPESCDSAGRV